MNQRQNIYNNQHMQNNNSAILFGNGINLVGGECPSWEDLLKDLSHQKAGMPSDSNTLNYECIYLDLCDYKYIGDGNSKDNEYELKKQIADLCERIPTNKFYRRLIELPVDTYLTTNYDGVLEKLLLQKDYQRNRKQSCITEALYSIRRCHAYDSPDESMTKKVFPIHGESKYPKSIMIGYDHYCGSLGKLDDFFKGNYIYRDGEKSIKLPTLLERLREDYSDVGSISLGRYWPDYFFTHNVHMIGIGLPLVESDLWWVLNKRCRYKRISSMVNNKIYFYGEPEKSILHLLEAFDVQIIPIEVRDKNEPKCWVDAYHKMFDELERNLI